MTTSSREIEQLESDLWEAADNLRANLLAFANQKLRAARDLLLPRLMSGEIAV